MSAGIKGRGPVDSPIVIVGESPNAVEWANKTVFKGPNSVVIQDALKFAALQLNIPLESIPQPYFCNAIRTYLQNKTPEGVMKAASEGRAELLAEISAHPRKIIIALGNAAAWAVTGNFNLKITQVRGTRYDTPLASEGVVVTVSPAFLLRGTGNFKQFKGDITYAIELGMATTSRVDFNSNVPFQVIRGVDDLESLVTKLRELPEGSEVAADIETASFDYWRQNEVLVHPEYTQNPILCLGLYFCTPDSTVGECFIVSPDLLCDRLFPPHLNFVWHNGKFDIKFFWHQNILTARVDHDTMLQSYTLNERRGIHDLDQVAADHLGTPNHKVMLEAYLPKKKMSYANIPANILYSYLALDVFKTYHIHKTLWPKICRDKHEHKLYTKLLLPAVPYLCEIEMNGMSVDVEWTKKNETHMGAEAALLEHNMNIHTNAIVGHSINPRSPIQLKEFLYGALKLGPMSLSTDVDTLETLPEHPFVKLLLKYRKVQKALSTYVLPDLELMAPDGKVHTSYLLHGTATGRLASRNPNKQNVPRDPLIRGQIKADEGYVFIEPDLNQAELRSLACMSGDTELCRIYNTEGLSLHDEVRDNIFGTPDKWSSKELADYFERFYIPGNNIERLREEQKMIAKNVNFGIVYGITSYGLADQIGRPGLEAAVYIDAWFKKFPQAKEFIDRCMEAAAKGETIITPYGRKKRGGIVTFDRLRDLKNEAANFPHQATASDFVLDTGARIMPILRKEFKTTIHNTVHDSLLLMTPMDIKLIKEVVEYTTTELSNTPKRMGMTLIPFKADAKIGNRWGHLIGADKWMAKNAQLENPT